MKSHRVLIHATVTTLLLHTSAFAAMVEFRYSGTLDYVNDPDAIFDSSITAGAPFSGTVFYDPDALNDEAPGEPTLGYFHSDTFMTAQVGGINFATTGLTFVLADNQPWDEGTGGSGVRDVFLASATNSFASQGIHIHQFALRLEDKSGSAWDDDSLPRPEDMLTIDAFPDDVWLSIVGSDQNGPSHIAAIHGIVDFINVAPEPATLALLGAAGLFIVGRRPRW